MPIHRQFTASCDRCGRNYGKFAMFSGDLKDMMEKDDWAVANTYTCPDCRHRCRCRKCRETNATQPFPHHDNIVMLNNNNNNESEQ